MVRGKAFRPPVQPLLSLALLALFVWGVGKSAFFPSLRLFQDTQWDFSFFFPTWKIRILSFLWLIPVLIGFWGWSRWAHLFFFRKMDAKYGGVLGLSLALSFFSLYIFGLAVNGILYRPLTALFFAPPLLEGWRSRKLVSFPWLEDVKSTWLFLILLPLGVWLLEFVSPPVVWDAVLDHFRYAREVARLHQIPFHWVNHTGDMPKAAELVLAGFWSLGGEALSKAALVLPVLLTLWVLSLFTDTSVPPTEPLTSLPTSTSPSVLPTVTATGGKGKNPWVLVWIFFTSPYFLALYAFGYAEGFLAFYEAAALFCFWEGLERKRGKVWIYLTAFFLGMAFAVKYTAVLAVGAVFILWIYWKWARKAPLAFYPETILLFILPLFPWALKNELAFGNPFYPLAGSVFGAHVGYSPEMERDLLQDTGVPWDSGAFQALRILWNPFFTSINGVNAALTPLIAMSLPWFWKGFREKSAFLVGSFCGLFFLGWAFVSNSLRHASGGAVALALLAAMAWDKALREKGGWGKGVFVLGAGISFWLCLSTQMTTTAPYASAFGLEDPLLRLKRNYTYDADTYGAYQFIEGHSDPWDKVMAFAVWQTYPLPRTAFVDFKWKKPIFLDWASQCRTAEELARKLHEEGVVYFLYQRWEAAAMSKMEREFKLEGMSPKEYARFWGLYTEPVFRGENTTVYFIRNTPLVMPRPLGQVPGLEEEKQTQSQPSRGNAYF